MARGASYLSPLSLSGDTEETINCHPDVAYRARIRLAPVTRKVAEWLKDGELLLTLFGSNPSPEALSRHKQGGGKAALAKSAAAQEAQRKGESREEELKRLKAEYVCSPLLSHLLSTQHRTAP
jgi:hypothetical protein